MRFKEFLLEMAIKIASINTGKRLLDIQIRTGNKRLFSGGRIEHYPAHIHVKWRQQLDVPLEIDTCQPPANKKEISLGSLTKEELAYIDDFINYYGKNELKQIFDAAQEGLDPEPLFKALKDKRDKEWSKKNAEKINKISQSDKNSDFI